MRGSVRMGSNISMGKSRVLHSTDVSIKSEPGRDDSLRYGKEAAHEHGFMGWMFRCQRCGTYGASPYQGEGPDGGPLVLCPLHARELQAEYKRHEEALKILKDTNYE